MIPNARIKQLVGPSAPPMPAPTEPDAEWPLRSLHLNEASMPPSPRVIEAMHDALIGLNRYPDHDGTTLCRAIAERLDVDADRVVVGSGSNELLFVSAAIALEPGNEVVAPSPGFPTYARSAALNGAVHVGVPLLADGDIDIDAMLAAVTPATRLLFVSSPHNPTGALLDTAHVEQLVAHTPPEVLLHFDEAYYEFGRHAGGPDTLPLLQRRSAPWISTRTFSKAYSLAGARIGYGICSSAELAFAYRAARGSFSVNAIALAGALAAWQDSGHLQHLLDHTAHERRRLAEGLARLGFDVLPSAANLLTAIAPRPASALAAALREKNIYVSAMPWPDTPGALRISIGSSEDTDAVCAVLGAVLKQA